jgi:cellulose synthase/poly-beta-1,6-N-acetylglucosamine synthase-like glycosyltransferase
MILVLISIGMGKSLDNNKVQITMKIIGFILCGFNMFVVLYALTRVLNQALSVLVVIIFVSTYFLPPLIYEPKNFCGTLLTRQLPGIFSYIMCMPLYIIVFQIYSYANIHDVSWGNRDASADLTL